MSIVFKIAVVLGFLIACAIIGICASVFSPPPADENRNPWEDER